MKILAYGEVMMRLEVPDYKKIIQSHTFDFSFVGTGLNVLTALEKFNHESYLLTTLPKNSLGDAVMADLRKYNISTQHVAQKGHHLGSYILEKGQNYVPSKVTYLNRSESSFNIDLLDEEQISQALEGMDYLHVCGIALATSEKSNQNVKTIVRMANEAGIKVILDFNYRSSLNKGYDLRKDYKYVLSKANIVFGSKRDIVELLRHKDKDNFQELLSEFTKKYDINIFAGTMKNEESYSGYLFKDKKLYRSRNYTINNPLENIGTGDAFAGALVHGLSSSPEDPQKIIEESTAYGALAHYTIGDKAVADPTNIEAVVKDKNPRVIR